MAASVSPDSRIALYPVLFHNSADASGGLTIVRTQLSAETLAAAHRPGTGFWNSVNQLIAQALMRVVVLDVLLDRVIVSLAVRHHPI